MNAPTAAPIWQAFAETGIVVRSTFAMRESAGHCFFAGHGQHGLGTRSDISTLTPSLRSGPSQAGPFPCLGRAGADCVSPVKICFEFRDIAVESAAITTNQRGSLPCANRLSFSPFFPLRWPVACRTLHRAVLPVPPLAPLSPTLSMRTSSQVRPSVALRALPPAGSSWACRPATRATEPHLDLAACGRAGPIARTTRARRPGGPLRFTGFKGGR
jgi:hypothetical protein